MVFIQLQYDVGPIGPSDKTVEFVHFVLYEFDQLPVGVEFYGLNLYVHNTMFYKVRYLRNCSSGRSILLFCFAPPVFSRGVSFGIDLLQLGDACYARIDLRRLQGRNVRAILVSPSCRRRC